MTTDSSSGQAPLSQAVALLNGGAHAQAVACLRRLLAISPDHPVALTLMGVALVEGGDASEAERFLRRALVLSPGRPEILCNLARAVRLGGRPCEAVRLCRSVLAHAPDYDRALAELAAACADTGAFEDALVVHRRIVARNPQSLDARRGLAASLLLTERPTEAEKVLREALALTPISGDLSTAVEVRRDLGDILKRRRAFKQALEQYDAVEPGNRVAGIEKRRAVVLQHLQRFDDAIKALRAYVTRDPLDMNAHLQLNELLHRQGRDHGFLQSYDEAAARVPESALPFIAKGRLLLKVGKPDIADAYFHRALQRAPADLAALIGHARAQEALGRTDSARAAYERALLTGPDDLEVLIDTSSFLLRKGEPDRAETLAGHALTGNPYNQEALALLTLCHRAVGDEREFTLAGYDTLVRVFDLDPPHGFDDMAAFNRELGRYLASLHTDVREHFTQTLRGGTRLFDAIFQNGHDLVDQLKPEIDRAIARYIRELPATASPAFRDRRSGGFNYVTSWSSQLSDRGFHSNHIHPEGWISSVYYVAVPDVCTDTDAREGWLKFGEPTADFGSAYDPRRLVEPKPGRLVLFPSYLWHGTTPFEAARTRMTIAFDIAPSSVLR